MQNMHGIIRYQGKLFALDNKEIKYLRGLKNEQKRRLFLLEGTNVR